MFPNNHFRVSFEDRDGARSDDPSAGAAIGMHRSRNAAPVGGLARQATYVEAFDLVIEEMLASTARMVVGLVADRYGDPAPPSGQTLRQWWVDWKTERRKAPVRFSRGPRPNPRRDLVWEMLDGISGPECRVLHQGSARSWAFYVRHIVAERDIALPGGLIALSTIERLVREYRKDRGRVLRSRPGRAIDRRSRSRPLPPACPEVLEKGLSE